jgi:hypothetical protein
MCNHVWRQVNEQSLLGGYFPIGYQCELCGQWISQYELNPAGLGGALSPRVELVGACGGYIDTKSGHSTKRQVYDRSTGKLSYEETDREEGK